jgi:hypothetical protein
MITANRSASARPIQTSVPRILLLLTVLVWLLFASEFPFSLYRMGIPLLLGLLALDVMLGIATDWLAFMPTSRLDERQASLRDRGYRIGFRLVGAGVLVVVLLSGAGYILKSAVVGPPVQSAASGLDPRLVTALVELLILAPTAVIAWLMPSDAETSIDTRSLAIAIGVVIGAAALWLLGVVAAPVQSATAVRSPDHQFGIDNDTCGHFTATKGLAGGFGGTARLEAEVCWNGDEVFTVGDPSLPRPASFQPQSWTEFNREPQLTTCSPIAGDADFGGVQERCTGSIDADGTLHLNLTGRIAPIPGNIAARDVRIVLVVTRSGKVLNFG